MTNDTGDLKVVYIPQVPMKAYEVIMPTQDLTAAAFVLDAIVGLSIFEFENNIKPDYSDYAAILRWEEDGEDGFDWFDVDPEEYETEEEN